MEKRHIKSLLKSDDNLQEQFLDNNNSLLNIQTDYERIEFDYSWLDKIESVLTYLDDIIRNPRKFIVQEEEVVGVEKAKKITLETIRHLAQHTNYIQSIDEDGTITPSKVLNVHKEESYDIYENRFIYSLLINLSSFLQRRKKITAQGSFCKVEKNLVYKARTNLDSENIEVSVNLATKSFDDLNMVSSNGSVEERIEKIELIINDYLKSQFIRELVSGNIVMVKSPIRKTNVILKNPNFQKALELWEFLEQYDINNKIESKESNEYDDETAVKDSMDFAFMLDYLILNNVYKKKEITPKKIRKYYIDKVLRDFVETNDGYGETEFKRFLNDEFKMIKKQHQQQQDKVIKVITSEVKSYQTSLSKLMDLMSN